MRDFSAGQPITFAATATDLEDGDLSAGLSWISNLDGALVGFGAEFTTSTLALGDHTITASGIDSGGLSGSESITLTVIADPAAPP